MPRHPTLLPDKDFRITAQIYNVEELYTRVYYNDADHPLVANYSYRSVDNTYVIGFNYTIKDESNQDITVPLANFYLQIIIND